MKDKRMQQNRYSCPFGCGTTIIRLPLDSDRKNENGDRTRKYVTENISNPDVRFVQCSEGKAQKDISMNLDNHIPFYKVDSFWDFDNIGVTKHIGSDEQNHKLPKIRLIRSNKSPDPVQYQICRYLTCGGCDKGAIGFGGYILDTNNDDRDSINVNPNDLTYFVCL